MEQVREYYESRLVIAASCMGAANFRRSFDYCIVDEASQLVEVSATHVFDICTFARSFQFLVNYMHCDS